MYGLSDIFSIEELQKEYENFDEFIKAMGLEEDMKKYNFVPIANDGMGGYYVFISNEPSDKIYYLDAEFPEELEECMVYENFKQYLEELYEDQIKYYEDNEE